MSGPTGLRRIGCRLRIRGFCCGVGHGGQRAAGRRGGGPVMTSARRAAGAPARSKRLFDLVGATLLLIVLSPVVSVVAVLVRLRLGRPIIYRQQRPGLGGRPFTHLQVPDDATRPPTRTAGSAKRRAYAAVRPAPSGPEPRRAARALERRQGRHEPRRTTAPDRRVPASDTAEQARRHEVRPGITGLAQVSGRNAISWEEKFALDVRLCRASRHRMDLGILKRTVGAVAVADGRPVRRERRHARVPWDGRPEFDAESADMTQTMLSRPRTGTGPSATYPAAPLHEAFAAAGCPDAERDRHPVP